MTRIAILVAIFLSWSVAHAAASDPVYPRGIRIGIVAPVGLSVAQTHIGFTTEDQGVQVILNEGPLAAFSDVEKAFKAGVPSNAPQPESLETKSGIGYYTVENGVDRAGKPVRRYVLIVSGGTFSGYVIAQVPENAQRIYTDDAVRAMFASATVRPQVPVAEQLAQLPFKVTDTADFPTIQTIAPGAAILFADSKQTLDLESAPYMVLGSVTNAPERPEDRARFAEQTARLVPGLRNARITMSEPMRISGTPGFETRIDAVSGANDTPVTVVQWLKFGNGPLAMRIIASTPKTDWSKAFPRFRAVRDGIQPL